MIGYTCNGGITCGDCWGRCPPPTDCGCGDHEPMRPSAGDTCGDCGACVVAGEWRTYEEAMDPGISSWVSCLYCNGQTPYDGEAPEQCPYCGGEVEPA